MSSSSSTCCGRPINNIQFVSIQEINSTNTYHKQQYKQKQQQQIVIRKNNRDKPVINNQLTLDPDFDFATVVTVVLNIHLRRQMLNKSPSSNLHCCCSHRSSCCSCRCRRRRCTGRSCRSGSCTGCRRCCRAC